MELPLWRQLLGDLGVLGGSERSVHPRVHLETEPRSFLATAVRGNAEDGFLWAEALGKRLRELAGPNLSLYVGAGLAELPALLMETCDLERKLMVEQRQAENQPEPTQDPRQADAAAAESDDAADEGLPAPIIVGLGVLALIGISVALLKPRFRRG